MGPGLVGAISQNANDNLQIGLRAGSIFPAVLIISVLIFMKSLKKAK